MRHGAFHIYKATVGLVSTTMMKSVNDSTAYPGPGATKAQ